MPGLAVGGGGELKEKEEKGNRVPLLDKNMWVKFRRNSRGFLRELDARDTTFVDVPLFHILPFCCFSGIISRRPLLFVIPFELHEEGRQTWSQKRLSLCVVSYIFRQIACFFALKTLGLSLG